MDRGTSADHVRGHSWDGAVVAAIALVNKDVAPYTVVAGMPARSIKYRFSYHVIERM